MIDKTRQKRIKKCTAYRTMQARFMEVWDNVTDVKATDLAKRFADAGVSSIVYTDIARDGMMQGVNIEQTVNLATYSGLPVIASGGVTNIDDVHGLKGQPGILGAITGRAIYEGTLNLREAQAVLDA
jgi:phosphoribosylformimino-5-aminoimidazole carboxamide ribotide isomerase